MAFAADVMSLEQVVLQVVRHGVASETAAPASERSATTIIAVAGNDCCADCLGAKPPAWASSDIGVVFCIDCSGSHRKLGAHLSKVLSLYLDDWTPEQVKHMRDRGNQRVNAELEANMPPHVRKPGANASAAEREAFIRAKYELRSFVAGGDGRLPAIAVCSASRVGMVEFMGVLFVKVLAASNLVSMDPASPSDPYAVLKMGAQSMRTKTIRDNNCPIWNEKLSFNVLDAQQDLRVQVWDACRCGTREAQGSGRLIGESAVPICAAIEQPAQPVRVTAEIELSAKAARRMGGNCIGRCLPCYGIGERLGGIYLRGKPSTVTLELSFASLGPVGG
jgi:stromal membrane-associated protein